MATTRQPSLTYEGSDHRRQASVASANDVLDALAYYSQDDMSLGLEDLQPPNMAALYTQQNRSVPNLPGNQRQQATEDVSIDSLPPPPPYDATAALDSFGALHISDPITRGGSAMAYRQEPSDPVPRTGTSMSMRSMTTPQRLAGPGGQLARVPQGAVPDPRMSDTMSVRSGRSGHSGHNQYHSIRTNTEDGVESDRASTYTYESPVAYGPQEGYAPAGNMSSPQRYLPPPSQGWQGPHQGPPPGGSFNTLYAAASDVLGMGPPPGGAAPPPPGQYAPYPPPPPQGPPANYAASSSSSLATSQSSGYMSPYTPNPPAGYPGGASLMRGASVSSSASGSSAGPPPSSMSPPTILEESEIEPRPSLQRSGTAASVTLRTQKTKAIDLSAPPYTKAYIDEYRQRIKDDPDPEAHFKYAKYLIDAARKIGADAKDQRSVKRYRDSLIQESLKVVRRLATQGQAYDEAQFFLANCHGTGMLGLQVDHERAYHLYLQAAKQNHAAACYRVAVCNEIGAGTRREPQRAAAFYRKAASLGDTAAMYKLGVILLRGSLGEQPVPRDAIAWLKRAAEQADEENPHALHELAMLYENPQSGVVPFDPHYARELYTRAGQLGYTHSQFKLGQCHEYGALTCPLDPKKSIAWYTKAAEKGHSEAELALSGWYLTGSDGVLKQSDSEAYLWARRAANKGLSKAEYAVGYYAEVGIGVKQDVEFAKRWYMRAAAQGNKRAMNRLTEMKRAGNKRAQMARPTRQDAKEECVIA